MSGHFSNHELRDILKGKTSSELWASNMTAEEYLGEYDEDASIDVLEADGGDLLPSQRLFGMNF